MKTLKKVAGKIGSILLNFAYDEDRSLNALGGGDAQATISSEIGTHLGNPVTDVSADILNTIQPGHVTRAVDHATALEKADDGFRG